MHQGKARLGDDIFTCQSEQRLIGSEGGGMVAEMCWCGETTASPRSPPSLSPSHPPLPRPRLGPPSSIHHCDTFDSRTSRPQGSSYFGGVLLV